ncbi:hypothetical protein B0H10DRAFT_2039192 [Mycena sp. CBHHK59/15]|nr:hypothetical protein B0H10DRAFT_2039192 [Mycena sp. CBHHK59/15]
MTRGTLWSPQSPMSESAADAIALLAAAARKAIETGPNHPYDGDLQATACEMQQSDPRFQTLQKTGRLGLEAHLMYILYHLLPSARTALVLETLSKAITDALELGNIQDPEASTSLCPPGIFCTIAGLLLLDKDPHRFHAWISDCLMDVLPAVAAAAENIAFAIPPAEDPEEQSPAIQRFLERLRQIQHCRRDDNQVSSVIPETLGSSPDSRVAV